MYALGVIKDMRMFISCEVLCGRGVLVVFTQGKADAEGLQLRSKVCDTFFPHREKEPAV